MDIMETIIAWIAVIGLLGLTVGGLVHALFFSP